MTFTLPQEKEIAKTKHENLKIKETNKLTGHFVYHEPIRNMKTL